MSGLLFLVPGLIAVGTLFTFFVVVGFIVAGLLGSIVVCGLLTALVVRIIQTTPGKETRST